MKLYYEKNPPGYENNEAAILIGIELSGIQKYIFNVIENKKSLEEIKQRSFAIEKITEIINDFCQSFLEIKKHEFLLNTSGKVLFINKEGSFNKDIFEQKMNNLARDVFLSYQGEIKLYYTFVNCTISNEAYDKEKNAYRDLSEKLRLSRRRAYQYLDYDFNKDFNNINKHYPIPKQWNIDEIMDANQPHKYVTGVKLDLDNLGEYFASIGRTDLIKQESQKIYSAIKEALNPIDKMLVIFIGGDDIFVLVNFYDMFSKIDEIYVNLKKAFTNISYNFSISCGAVVTSHKSSILYYGEKLEDELSNAKESGKNGVSLEGIYLSWSDFSKIKKGITLYTSQFRNNKTAYLSQLANIENTVLGIRKNPNKNEVVREFILKIPQINSKIKNILPKSLYCYTLNADDKYISEIDKFIFTIKYLRRFLGREK